MTTRLPQLAISVALIAYAVSATRGHVALTACTAPPVPQGADGHVAVSAPDVLHRTPQESRILGL